MSDVLDRLIELHGEYAEGDNRIGVDLADAIREIERLRAATRWRSVAEELPEHMQRVYCGQVGVYEGREFYAEYHATCFHGELGKPAEWEDDNGEREMPTHWQPLPEPPK